MIDVFFENIESIILEQIVVANTSIKIALAYFTDKNIFDKLCLKAERGVKIQLILSDEISNFQNSKINFDELVQNGGELYFYVSEDDSILHNKFCIVDDRIILNGSYNWSNKAKRNLENIFLISEEHNVTNKFLEEFDKIKNRSKKRVPNRKDYILHTGFNSFDKAFIGIISGSTTVICAKQHLGLTSLSLSFFNKMVLNNLNKEWLYISVADNKETILQKLRSIMSGVELDKITKNKKGILEHELVNLNIATNNLNRELEHLTVVELKKRTLYEVQNEIQINLSRHTDCKLIVIDDFDKLSQDYNANGFVGFEGLIKLIKELSLRYNIAIVCLLPISNKDANQIERGSLGVIEDHADTIYYLSEPDYNNSFYDSDRKEFTLNALKNRNGKTGNIALFQNPITKEFSDLPLESENYKFGSNRLNIHHK